jgi:F-type H+-transporting ATPase subunit b
MPLAEENVLVPAMGELIIGLIAFALLAFVLMRYVWPRLEQVYRERRDAIEGGIARAEAAQAEAQRTLEQYQAQLAEARNEAAQIREGARAEAQRIVEELRTQAQEESARIVSRGEEQLRNQRGQVVRELRGEIGSLAVELSERIVGQHLADDAQVRSTVDAFLADLEQQDQASAP